MPELKKFLVTNKEADQYENLTVKFIPGRKAILTILNDGKETEKIVLSDYNDREKMHALLAEKGFKKKSSEELHKLEEEVAAAAAKKGAPAIPKDRKTSVTIKRVAKTDAAAAVTVTETASEVGAVQRVAKEVEKKDGDGEGDDDSGGDDDQANDDDSGSDSEEDDDTEGDDDEADDDDDSKDLEPKKKEGRREIGGEVGGEGTKSKTPPKPVPPQLRKAKKQSSDTKNSKEASASQQFVLVASTLCIVCFALSRKFPILRVLSGRLFGGRHQHAR